MLQQIIFNFLMFYNTSTIISEITIFYLNFIIEILVEITENFVENICETVFFFLN